MSVPREKYKKQFYSGDNLLKKRDRACQHGEVDAELLKWFKGLRYILPEYAHAYSPLQKNTRFGVSWRTTQTMQRKIQTFFNTCLRHIYKIQWQEKIRNEELWERAGQEPVAKQILRRKWGWIGHTLRKPASSTTRQALT